MAPPRKAQTDTTSPSRAGESSRGPAAPGAASEDATAVAAGQFDRVVLLHVIPPLARLTQFDKTRVKNELPQGKETCPSFGGSRVFREDLDRGDLGQVGDCDRPQ